MEHRLLIYSGVKHMHSTHSYAWFLYKLAVHSIISGLPRGLQMYAITCKSLNL